MVDDKDLMKLGKELAELGINLENLNTRIKALPDENKRHILKGFSSTVLKTNPAEAYLAAKESGDKELILSSIKKMLSEDLRAATRIAINNGDTELMEAIVEEATKKEDNITVEIMKTHLREKKLQELSKQISVH